MGARPRHAPQGPFAAPLPKDVDAVDGEPMAVANDKQQTHGESFGATTSPRDPYDADVARRYRQVPTKRAASEDETRRMQHPPGYSEPDADGFAHLEEE